MSSPTSLVPFAFARSALFALPPDWVPSVNPQPIAAATDYAISVAYAGPRLTHRHAAMWQAVVALSYQGEGQQLEPDQRLIDLLRVMGLVSVQTNAKRRGLCLLGDLAAAWVVIQTPRHSYSGSILEFTPTGTGRVRVSLPTGLLPLLSDEIVRLPMDTRESLHSYPLAAWLHDYIATHRGVYSVKLGTLRSLCGSQLSPHHFGSRLVLALDRLKACAPFFTGYEIRGGLLTIRKDKTGVVLLSQQVKQAKAKRWQDMSAIERARATRATVVL